MSEWSLQNAACWLIDIWLYSYRINYYILDSQANFHLCLMFIGSSMFSYMAA